jgi:hypothetical protein
MDPFFLSKNKPNKTNGTITKNIPKINSNIISSYNNYSPKSKFFLTKKRLLWRSLVALAFF